MKPTLLNSLLAALLLVVTGCGATSNPQDVPGSGASRRTSAEHDLAEAQRYLAEGLDDSALAAFGLAIAKNPRLTEAHLGMGSIYLKRENFVRASDAFEAATRYEPNSFDAHYFLGVARQMMGRFDLALSAYLQAVALKPDDFDANLNLAGTYLMLNQPRQALAYARTAVRLNEAAPGAWANLAATYSLLGHDEMAVEAYRTVMELDDPADQVLLGLADAHIKLGNYDRAVNVLESLAIRSPSALANERLGYAYFKMLRFDRALASYRAALELDANDVPSLNGLGVCLMTVYLQSGGSDPSYKTVAIDAWRHSLKIQPDQPRIVDLLSRYENLWTTKDIRKRQHE